MAVAKFIDHFVACLKKLIGHNYVHVRQSNFLQETKENLQPNEFVVINDFAENYSFVIQDEIQAFHWMNEQCTIHPTCVYYKDAENKLCNISFAFIAESLEHSVVSVALFQQKLIESLQSRFQTVKKIYFFSDGAASQYKNRKNFFNICELQFTQNIIIEWHFSATYHGKSPCDGIGGTIKRMATRASLQRVYTRHILNAKSLYEFLVATGTSIVPVFCTTEEHDLMKEQLKNKYDNVRTIKGTQSFHCFIPQSLDTILTKKTSTSEKSQIFRLK